MYDACLLKASRDGSWVDGRLPSLNFKRCGHGCVSTYEDSIVVMGGYGGRCEGGQVFFSSTEILSSPSSPTWMAGPDMGYLRSGFASGLLSSGCIVVAGGSSDGTHVHASAQRLDLREGRWTSLPDMHKARGYLSGCVVGDGSFVVGGGTLVDGHMESTGELERYDPRANRWTLLADTRSAQLSRSCHSAVLLL